MSVKYKQEPPDPKPGLIRLNLGCGGKLWPGFINVDFPGNWSGLKPDVECDIRHLPFPDNYADEVYSIHVIEHIYRWDTMATLKEWVRVLKPGGMLVLECPNLEKILHQFDKPVIDIKMTLWGLYGNPSYREEAQVHKWCFCVDEIVQLIQHAGCEQVRVGTPEFHDWERDARYTGIKKGEDNDNHQKD